MPNEKKNIDKLFTSGIEKDAPVFKEEYWTDFEKMLDKAPAPVPKNGKPSGSALSSSSLIKGIILLFSAGIIVTVAVLIFNNKQENTKADKELVSLNDEIQTSSTPNTSETPGIDKNISNINDEITQTPQKPISNEAAKPPLNTDRDSGKSIPPVGSDIYDQGDKKDNTENPPSDINKDDSSRPDDFTVPDTITNESTDVVEDLPPVADNDTMDDNDTIIDPSGGDSGSSPPTRGNNRTEELSNEKLRLSVSPGILGFNRIGNTGGFEKSFGVSPSIYLELGYQINKKLGLNCGLSWIYTTGHELTHSTTQAYYLLNERKVTNTVENRALSYLSIPVTLQYHYKRHAFGAGPQLWILMNASGNKTVTTKTPFSASFESDAVKGYTEGLKPLAFGISAEYSYRFSERYAATIRYTLMNTSFLKEEIYTGAASDRINSLNLSLRYNILNIKK